MNIKKVKLRYFIGLLLLIGMIFKNSPLLGKELIIPVAHIPPTMITNKKEPSGIHVDVLKEIAHRLNLQVKFRKCSFKRCLRMMKDGTADIQAGLLRRPEREVYMHYINPPYKKTSTKAFYVKNGKKNLIKTYEDLYGLKIGVMAGSQYFPRFDNDTKIVKHELTNTIQQLLLLERDRVDTIIGTEQSIDYMIIVEGFKGAIQKSTYKYDQDNLAYFAISKKSPYAKELSKFKKVMKDLITEGMIDKITNNYYKNLALELDR
mgnify:CR=1 FL=1